jgi:hypothetical protein
MTVKVLSSPCSLAALHRSWIPTERAFGQLAIVASNSVSFASPCSAMSFFHVGALAPAARLTDDSERSPANVDGKALPPLMAADGRLPFQSACVLG